jgi:uncharacterized OsmC-like protein
MAGERPINGIDRERLGQTVKHMRENPSQARFEFRAHHKWIDGAHSRSTIKDFYGAGKEDTSRTQEFQIDADEPDMLLGTDQGPNATEALLHALASCLNATFVYYCAANSVAIQELELELVGQIDLRGFLGITDEVRRGFSAITVTFKVKSDAPRDELEEMVRLARKYSPVYDMVTNQAAVSVQLRLKEPVTA